MLGVDQATCSAAAKATGPTELCGEMAMSCAAAIAAIFFATAMPPQCATSICTTSAARSPISRAKSAMA